MLRNDRRAIAREQHLSYRSTADVVVLDGDGSRWVRERACRLVEDRMSAQPALSVDALHCTCLMQRTVPTVDANCKVVANELLFLRRT